MAKDAETREQSLIHAQSLLSGLGEREQKEMVRDDA
jgi:hypothetical protein